MLIMGCQRLESPRSGFSLIALCSCRSCLLLRAEVEAMPMALALANAQLSTLIKAER